MMSSIDATLLNVHLYFKHPTSLWNVPLPSLNSFLLNLYSARKFIQSPITPYQLSLIPQLSLTYKSLYSATVLSITLNSIPSILATAYLWRNTILAEGEYWVPDLPNVNIMFFRAKFLKILRCTWVVHNGMIPHNILQLIIVLLTILKHLGYVRCVDNDPSGLLKWLLNSNVYSQGTDSL